MRKNLIISLKGLAQDILRLEANEDLSTLKMKTEEIYNKLVILEYLTKNIDSLESETAEGVLEEAPKSKIVTKPEEMVVEKIEEELPQDLYEEKKPEEFETLTAVSDEITSEVDNENNNLDKTSEENMEDLEDLFEPKFDSIKEDFSLKDEFKDTVSLDETENLFETKKSESKSVSLNDKLLGKKIQIGLNDRIAFVNILFNFNQSEFNKILNELNAFDTEMEAKNYIENSVKMKYNWSGKEDVEERFMILIERKFL